MLCEGTHSTGKSVNCTDKRQTIQEPALAAQGSTVGLLDAAIYRPSLPQLLGIVSGRSASAAAKGLQPMQAQGIQAMSIGFVTDPGQHIVWRIGDPTPLPQVRCADRFVIRCRLGLRVKLALPGISHVPQAGAMRPTQCVQPRPRGPRRAPSRLADACGRTFKVGIGQVVEGDGLGKGGQRQKIGKARGNLANLG